MNDHLKNEVQRYNGIDAIAGIMIINMMTYHCYTLPFHIFLSFFMPWFFFKSGMFYKRQNIKDCITTSASKLLYPFMTFTIIGWFVECVIFLSEGDHYWTDYITIPLKELFYDGSLYGNKPLWFLFSFFVVKVIFSFVENNIKYPIVVILPAIVLAYISYLYGNPLPRYFANVCSGLAFFSMGYVFRKIQFLTPVSIIAIIAYLLFVVFEISSVDMFPNTLVRGNYLLWIVFSFVGCIAFNSIFEKIPYRFKLLSFVGKNSMVLYVTHFIILRLYEVITEPFDMNGRVRVLGMFAVLAISEYLIILLFRLPQMQILLKPRK